MTRKQNPRILFAANGQGWLQRIIVFVLAAAVAVLACLFITVALLAGALIAAIIALRWWWLARKLRTASAQDVLEGEYTVIEHSSRNSSSAAAGQADGPPARHRRNIQ